MQVTALIRTATAPATRREAIEQSVDSAIRAAESAQADPRHVAWADSWRNGNRSNGSPYLTAAWDAMQRACRAFALRNDRAAHAHWSAWAAARAAHWACNNAERMVPWASARAIQQAELATATPRTAGRTASKCGPFLTSKGRDNRSRIKIIGSPIDSDFRKQSRRDGNDEKAWPTVHIGTLPEAGTALWVLMDGHWREVLLRPDDVVDTDRGWYVCKGTERRLELAPGLVDNAPTIWPDPPGLPSDWITFIAYWYGKRGRTPEVRIRARRRTGNLGTAYEEEQWFSDNAEPDLSVTADMGEEMFEEEQPLPEQRHERRAFMLAQPCLSFEQTRRCAVHFNCKTFRRIPNETERKHYWWALPELRAWARVWEMGCGCRLCKAMVGYLGANLHEDQRKKARQSIGQISDSGRTQSRKALDILKKNPACPRQSYFEWNGAAWVRPPFKQTITREPRPGCYRPALELAGKVLDVDRCKTCEFPCVYAHDGPIHQEQRPARRLIRDRVPTVKYIPGVPHAPLQPNDDHRFTVLGPDAKAAGDKAMSQAWKGTTRAWSGAGWEPSMLSVAAQARQVRRWAGNRRVVQWQAGMKKRGKKGPEVEQVGTRIDNGARVYPPFPDREPDEQGEENNAD